LWIAAVDGTATANGVEAEVDLSHGDVLSQTDFAFMGALHAIYRQRWLVFVDLVIADISDDQTSGTPLGTLFTDVESRMIRAELFGGRRLWSGPLAELLGSQVRDDDPRTLSLDLYGGFRYWYLRDEVDLALGPIRADTTNTNRWVDPVVGARVQLRLSERISMNVGGNIAGFGIGSASDRSWQFWPVVSYDLTDRWSLASGYRWTSVDRKDGDDETDLLWHGPVVGAIYRF
jgi:hypothetical protein